MYGRTRACVLQAMANAHAIQRFAPRLIDGCMISCRPCLFAQAEKATVEDIANALKAADPTEPAIPVDQAVEDEEVRRHLAPPCPPFFFPV